MLLEGTNAAGQVVNIDGTVFPYMFSWCAWRMLVFYTRRDCLTRGLSLALAAGVTDFHVHDKYSCRVGQEGTGEGCSPGKYPSLHFVYVVLASSIQHYLVTICDASLSATCRSWKRFQLLAPVRCY